MSEVKPFLSQTAQTASFAFREYFRPLLAAARFWKSRQVSNESADFAADDRLSLEAAKAILRKRLAQGRRNERLLLIEGMTSALASLLTLAIALMFAFQLSLPVLLAILVPATTFGVWVLLRLLETREEIVELKTIRWVLKSVDQDTAERMAKQISWGKTGKKSESNKNKKPRNRTGRSDFT